MTTRLCAAARQVTLHNGTAPVQLHHHMTINHNLINSDIQVFDGIAAFD
jgi:hypothetical protein